MRHRTIDELLGGVEEIRRSPADAGRVELIVRRPAHGERAVRGPRRGRSRTAALAGDQLYVDLTMGRSLLDLSGENRSPHKFGR